MGRSFAVVADEVCTLANRSQQSTQDISQRIQDIQRDSAQAVDTGDQSVTVRFFSGLATAPDNGCDPDALISATDTALYGAKKDGRDRLQVFDGV